MKIKELIKKYEIAVKESDKAMQEYENEPENEEKEKAFDAAYKKEVWAFTDLANNIRLITDFKIDFETAKIMIKTRLDDLKNLVEMLG